VKNIGSQLMQEIKNLSEVEVQKLEVQFAKFNKEVNSYFEEKIISLEENINSQIKFYGKKLEECVEEKEKILNKYKEEFQKSYDIRKEQFFNIQTEIQELEANQKIALANFKKIVEDKDRLLESKVYSDYMHKKEEFQKIIDSTLNHEEFDRYTKLLEELVDPLDSYSKKLSALVNKYAGYDEIIAECEKKLEECTQATKGDFNKITKYRTTALAVNKKGNFITSFLKKIFSRLGGSSKIEKEVFKKMQDELIDVEKDNTESVNEINNQTINLIAKIEELREVMNAEFKLAIE